MVSHPPPRGSPRVFYGWWFHLVLLSAPLVGVAGQRTYMRSCDCEYIVDGKCAYTIMLPLNKGALPEQTCPEQSNPHQSSNPPGGQNMQTEVESLVSNVTSLGNKMAEQSHMLNQLQSLILSLKITDGGVAGQNNQTSTPNQTSTDNQHQTSTDNQHQSSVDNQQEINGLTESVETLNTQLSSLRETTTILDGDIGNVRESIALLSAQVAALDGVSETFRVFMDTTRPEIERMRAEVDEIRAMGIYCNKKGFMVGRGDNSTVNVTVSSEYNLNHGKDKLNVYNDDVPGAWCPREPNTPGQEWIQFDLGRVRSVYGIVTRGRSDYEQWVETFMVYYSPEDNPLDTQWIPVKDMLGIDTMIFDGNKNQFSPKYNYFDNHVVARYIRIIPLSANQGPNLEVQNMCMRADVIGCIEEITPP